MTKSSDTYLDFTTEPDFEKILTNPILDIAARFWEDDRYLAFKTCYRSMRILDDLVDNRKAEGTEISPAEILLLKNMITDWFDSFRKRKAYDDYQQELIDTIEKFQIPIWPWERLAKAMIYDLENDGFSTFMVFRRYSEGAAIAPASIFMHLCGVKKENGKYIQPTFDIRKSARPLALFSYLVHIVRDFQKDQKQGLNYFGENILDSLNLDKKTLRNIADGLEIPDSFRILIRQYSEFAFYYLKKSRTMIDNRSSYMESRYHLSLEIIYQLYLQIFQRINPAKGSFTTEELNPKPDEINSRIQQTIKTFDRTF